MSFKVKKAREGDMGERHDIGVGSGPIEGGCKGDVWGCATMSLSTSRVRVLMLWTSLTVLISCIFGPTWWTLLTISRAFLHYSSQCILFSKLIKLQTLLNSKSSTNL